MTILRRIVCALAGHRYTVECIVRVDCTTSYTDRHLRCACGHTRIDRQYVGDQCEALMRRSAA